MSFHVPTSLYFLETESYIKWLLYSLALLAGDFIFHHLKSHPLSSCSTIRDGNLSAIYKGATTILLLWRRFLPLSLVSDCPPQSPVIHGELHRSREKHQQQWTSWMAFLSKSHNQYVKTCLVFFTYGLGNILIGWRITLLTICTGQLGWRFWPLSLLNHCGHLLSFNISLSFILSTDVKTCTG